MFDYTFAAVGGIYKELKSIYKWFTIFVRFAGIAYLTYMLFAPAGVFAVNIALLAVCLGEAVFHIATYDMKGTRIKKIKKTTKKSARWMKIAIKSFSIAFAVYGIYTAVTEEKAISIILAATSAVIWLLQVMFALVVDFIEKRAELITSAFAMDTAVASKAINFVKKVRGQEYEEKTVSAAVKEKLEALATQRREEKRTKKEEARAHVKEHSLFANAKREITSLVKRKLAEKNDTPSVLPPENEYLDSPENSLLIEKQDNLLPAKQEETVTK